MPFLRKFICLFLIFQVTYASPTPPSCHYALRQAIANNEIRIPYQIIDSELREGFFSGAENLLTRSDESLFIGILNTPNGFHYYLNVDGMRFSGEPIYKTSQYRQSNLFNRGVVFEIPVGDVSIQRLKDLLAEQAEGSRFRSCVHGLCHFLDLIDVDITTNLDSEIVPFRSLTPQNIAERLLRGHVTIEGEPLPPEQIRMYATHFDDLNKLIQDIPESEIRTINFLVASYLTQAFIIISVSGIGMIAVLAIGSAVTAGVSELMNQNMVND